MHWHDGEFAIDIAEHITVLPNLLKPSASMQFGLTLEFAQFFSQPRLPTAKRRHSGHLRH
jgi:hypothetical protein